MRSRSLSLLALLALPLSLDAQSNAIRYEIRFPQRAHHEAEIEATFPALPPTPLRIRMSRSSPGRYAAHEFAKNVYAVRAINSAGKPLPVTRVSPHEWSVAGHDGTVRFAYTLFADRADGTYSGIDESLAHLNIPATLAWARGLDQRPVHVRFVLPDTSWRIATQLEPTTDRELFRAPNLQYLMDSPTHLGRLDTREWTVVSGGRTQTIRLAVDHLGTAAEVTSYTESVQKVVAEMAAVFGELPVFDFGSYTFIACYRPNCVGDGMEHRNSTSVTSSGSLAQSAGALLGTVSHEFFHAWNVERIRPKSLEPFDFTDANMSGELWLAEGFTNYYGPLVITRAGLRTQADYARGLTGAINTLTNAPGRQLFGAVGMSQRAPFVDAATAIDPTNWANTFISYYTYGEALGIALDLTLRTRTPSVTLDDFFREMWRRHGKAQTPALAPLRPYTLADAEAALAAVTKDPAFARDWFARFVVGNALPDYPTLLARAGMVVRPVRPTDAWLGDVSLRTDNGRAIVATAPRRGSPAYEAGLDAGDRLLRVGTAEVTSTAELMRALGEHKAGDKLLLVWEGDDGRREKEITLRTNPRIEVLLLEDAGGTPSANQLSFRAAWLGSKQ